MASDVDIGMSNEYKNEKHCGDAASSTHLTSVGRVPRRQVGGGQTPEQPLRGAAGRRHCDRGAAEGAQEAGWRAGGLIGGDDAIVAVMTPAKAARLDSIGNVPWELLRAGLELREWTDIDANARHRAKRNLGKLDPRKIVKKIRASLENKVSDEGGAVAMVEKLTVAPTAQLAASGAQAPLSPPISCPRQVVEGQGGVQTEAGSELAEPGDSRAAARAATDRRMRELRRALRAL